MDLQADGPIPHISLTRRISQTMARHPTPVAIVLIFALTMFSDYAKSLSKPVTMGQPLPKRFFPASSLVLDYPYGNIGDVGNLLVDREALFVMYYAPWCAKSRRLRSEFDKAASYMGDDLQFVGVNAWFPNGTCRKQNNFAAYPVFYFYHMNREGYRYKGVLSAQYMIQFAYKMLYPLVFLYGREELHNFMAHNDNTVVGFFDFNSSPQPPGFLQYYYASLRLYEIDPKNPVGFGVITSSDFAAHHGFLKTNSIHFIRSLNSTMKFPMLQNMTSSNISNWVLLHRQGLSLSWILPSGTKSMVLSSQLGTPTVLLFTPHNPLGTGNQYANMMLNYALIQLREVALDYYNCQNSSRIFKMIDRMTYSRWVNTLEQLELHDTCQNDNQVAAPCRLMDRTMPTKRCCQSVMVNEPHSGYNSCDVCLNYIQTNPLSWLPCSMKSVLDLPTWPSFRESFPTRQGACAETMPYYNPGEFLTVCCENHSYYQMSFSEHYLPHGTGRKSNDPFVINSTKNKHKKLCERLKYQQKHGWDVSTAYLSDVVSNSESNVTGLACGTNRTLAFITLDTRRSYMFAQRLGLNVTSKTKQPLLVIFDNQTEQHYIMNKPVTKSNIVDFIHNFTRHSLNRHLRSSSVQSTCDSLEHDICVIDLNSDNFNHTVMNSDQDVMVLFQSPSCGFCMGFNHVYLALAKYFKYAENIIFTRLDADRNGLPWQYTVDVYPTIMMFPAHRKSDSITFPDHLHKTLPNLIFFILQYSSATLRLQTGLSICSRACISANIATTTQRIHSLNHAIHLLVKSHNILQSKIQNFNHEPESSGDMSISDDGNEEYLTLLQWYDNVVTKRLWVKRLQMQEARHLHRVLIGTQGPFIEKHKLFAILKRYSVYEQRFTDMEDEANLEFDDTEEMVYIDDEEENVGNL